MRKDCFENCPRVQEVIGLILERGIDGLQAIRDPNLGFSKLATVASKDFECSGPVEKVVPQTKGFIFKREVGCVEYSCVLDEEKNSKVPEVIS